MAVSDASLLTTASGGSSHGSSSRCVEQKAPRLCSLSCAPLFCPSTAGVDGSLSKSTPVKVARCKRYSHLCPPVTTVAATSSAMAETSPSAPSRISSGVNLFHAPAPVRVSGAADCLDGLVESRLPSGLLISAASCPAGVGIYVPPAYSAGLVSPNNHHSSYRCGQPKLTPLIGSLPAPLGDSLFRQSYRLDNKVQRNAATIKIRAREQHYYAGSLQKSASAQQLIRSGAKTLQESKRRAEDETLVTSLITGNVLERKGFDRMETRGRRELPKTQKRQCEYIEATQNPFFQRGQIEGNERRNLKRSGAFLGTWQPHSRKQVQRTGGVKKGHVEKQAFSQVKRQLTLKEAVSVAVELPAKHLRKGVNKKDRKCKGEQKRHRAKKARVQQSVSPGIAMSSPSGMRRDGSRGLAAGDSSRSTVAALRSDLEAGGLPRGRRPSEASSEGLRNGCACSFRTKTTSVLKRIDKRTVTNEKIVAAEWATRELLLKFYVPCLHHALVVATEKGRLLMCETSFLQGVSISDVLYMDMREWTSRALTVNQDSEKAKTVGELIDYMARLGKTGVSMVDYFLSGMCYVASQNGAVYLASPVARGMSFGEFCAFMWDTILSILQSCFHCKKKALANS